jgi:hypothetical protein
LEAVISRAMAFSSAMALPHGHRMPAGSEEAQVVAVVPEAQDIVHGYP